VQERTEELYAANEELQSINEELATLNSELVEANLRLEEATRAKSDFLAAMSHELRTPLNSIIGFSGVLLQGLTGPVDDEQRRQIGMINNSGRHLLELINKVLDLSKIESGHVRPDWRRIDLRDVVLKMVDTVRPLAQAKGLEIVATLPETPALVTTDGTRVGQILLNLLGNAIKFTGEGRVDVTVATESGSVAISVSDTGRGIGPDDIARVFDDFYQVVPPDGGKSEGTGLGLSVSRRLAESVGARLGATSEAGSGSRFTLTVPSTEHQGRGEA
jgi:signal transduction histidine kinase